jgi:Ni/Fe-hydrogenase subunit HybB-like protein
MQERRVLTDKQINQELLSSITETPRAWYIIVPLLAIVFIGAACAAGYMFNRGLGVTGLNRPVMWGFFITNFVFWVGISHAGVMLSAILRLSQAEWRRPATRAAEIVTVFALATAAMHPVLHSGRPWRTLYWAFPIDFARGIWPDIRSALVWDPSAIFTYLISSILFVFIALIPDLAVLRDRSKGIGRVIYGALALGFRGSPRQWRLQAIAGILLSALILPVFVSVHSIVSWDFGMSIATEGWHTTIFAPYFVIGAIHSGVSAVVTALAFLRWIFHWENYIRPEHFDALGRLLIVVATAWFFFFSMEFIYGMWLLEPQEIALRELQVFQPPFRYLFITFLLASYFIPVPLWMFRRVRRSIALMFWTSILVNVGMWLERFILIVPSLMRKTSMTFTWGNYSPSPIELTIVAGSFAMVFLGILTFAKFFPLIPVFDIKEGEILKEEIRVGRVKVPAIIRED